MMILVSAPFTAFSQGEFYLAVFIDYILLACFLYSVVGAHQKRQAVHSAVRNKVVAWDAANKQFLSLFNDGYGYETL